MGKKLVERRRRGVFGWFFLLVFWGWNALMVLTLFNGIAGTSSEYERLATDAARQGYSAGVGMGILLLLVLWAVGSVVTGMLAFFTRGRAEMVEMDA